MKTIYFEVSIAKIFLTKLLAKPFPNVYYSSVSPMQYKEIPDRDLPGRNWVRVKNRQAGICGADMSLFFVKADPRITIAALPGVPRAFMGHELVGTVIETGAGVADLAVGDRVVLQRYLPCCSIKEIDPPCAPCREGNYTLCENFSEGEMPENLGAGFGDHFVAHRSQLVKIPDSLSDDTAVMIEPTSVSLHAVMKRPPQKGEHLLVLGAGVIGLNVIRFARLLQPDCSIHVIEKVTFKQDLAKRMGADVILDGDPYESVAKLTGARLYRGPLGNSVLMGGFDLIYDCVGHSSTLHDSLRWLRSRGDYVMIGNQLAPVRFDQTPIWNQEINVTGVNAHGCETYQGEKISSFDLTIRMITQGIVNLDGFITHRFPLKDYREAFRRIHNGREKIIKAVLVSE
jgi:threonine dehydrogenase-like Zn-dependent dehydrogenase